MASVRYPMKLVSQRTGLSPHVLRVWERRYGAVRPERSDTNRRLYSEEEIARLELMAQLSEAGHSIGHVAALPTPELQSLVDALPRALPPERPAPAGSVSEEFLAAAWSFVVDLDTGALRTVLEKASVSLGLSRLAPDLIVPLIDRIGDAWDEGEISAAEEHAASAVIKEVLLVASRPFAETMNAPNLVIGTPVGQLHELGAALVSFEARRHGWDVTYLGPSLPASEIARAAVRNDSLAVALSIVYPGDDPKLPEELRRLRRSLRPGIMVLVGGCCAHFYKESIEEIGATVASDLKGLGRELAALRRARGG